MRRPRDLANGVFVAEEGRDGRARLKCWCCWVRLRLRGGHSEVVDSDGAVDGSCSDEMRVVFIPIKREHLGRMSLNGDLRRGEAGG